MEAARSPNGLLRLDMPSGHWWEVETRPKWGEMMDMRRAIVEITNDGGAEDYYLTKIMTMVTRDWSYEDDAAERLPITVASVNGMDLEDACEVMHVVNEKIIPLLLSIAERSGKPA
jgi:hypothetical protein